MIPECFLCGSLGDRPRHHLASELRRVSRQHLAEGPRGVFVEHLTGTAFDEVDDEVDVGILNDDLVAGNFKVLPKVCWFRTYSDCRTLPSC